MHRILVTGKNKDMTPALRGVSRTQEIQNRNSRVVDCLSARGEGRPVAVADFATGRPTTSGMKPDAVVATVSRHQCATHSRLSRAVVCSARQVASPSPAIAPPGDLLNSIQEVVTVVAGLIVFGGIAYFCLVLA